MAAILKIQDCCHRLFRKNGNIGFWDAGDIKIPKMYSSQLPHEISTDVSTNLSSVETVDKVSYLNHADAYNISNLCLAHYDAPLMKNFSTSFNLIDIQTKTRRTNFPKTFLRFTVSDWESDCVTVSECMSEWGRELVDFLKNMNLNKII